MKSKQDVLRDKQLEIARLRKEVDALRIVAPLLVEECDLPQKFPVENNRAADVTEDKFA